jgi:hypothetical protein
MTLADHITTAQTWCRKHWIPYIHGCAWDRECRNEGAPMRVALMCGRYMAWVDLPGYYMDTDLGHTDDQGYVTRRRMWHAIHVRAHYNRTINQ